jgi:hypothetical protein
MGAWLTRDEFLENHWLRYPPETSGFVQDCPGFLAHIAMDTGSGGFGGWVGGRLSAASPGSRFELSSGGSSFAIDFADAQWARTCVRTRAGGDVPAFDPVILREGDLVCVKVIGRPPQIRADSVRLLFASQDPSWASGPSMKFVADFPLATAERWQLFTKLTREFFSSRGFLEARTPTLVPSAKTYLESKAEMLILPQVWRRNPSWIYHKLLMEN